MDFARKLSKFEANEETNDSINYDNYVNIPTIQEMIDKKDIVNSKQCNYFKAGEPSFKIEYNAQENITILELLKEFGTRSGVSNFDLIVGHLTKSTPNDEHCEDVVDCSCSKCMTKENRYIEGNNIAEDRTSAVERQNKHRRLEKGTDELINHDAFSLKKGILESSFSATHMQVEEKILDEIESSNTFRYSNRKSTTRQGKEEFGKETQDKSFEETESQASSNVNSFGIEAARLGLHKPLTQVIHVPIKMVKEEPEVPKNIQESAEKDFMDAFEEFLINNLELVEVSKIKEVENEHILRPTEVHVPVKVSKEEFDDFVCIQESTNLDFIDSLDDLIDNVEAASEVLINNDYLNLLEKVYKIPESQAVITESKEKIRNPIVHSRFEEVIDNNLKTVSSLYSEDTNGVVGCSEKADDSFKESKGEEETQEQSDNANLGIHIDNKSVQIRNEANESNLFLVEVTIDSIAETSDEIAVNVESKHTNSFRQLDQNNKITGVEASGAEETPNDNSRFREKFSESDLLIKLPGQTEDNEEVSTYNPVSTETDENVKLPGENQRRQHDNLEEFYHDSKVTGVEVPDEVEILACRSFIAEEMDVILEETTDSDFEGKDSGRIEDALEDNEIMAEEILKSNKETETESERVSCDDRISKGTKYTVSSEVLGDMEHPKETQVCSYTDEENSAAQEEPMIRYCKRLETVEHPQRQYNSDEVVPRDITIENPGVTIHSSNDKELPEEIEIKSEEQNSDHLHIIEVTQPTLSITETQESSHKNFDEIGKNSTTNSLGKVSVEESLENQTKDDNFTQNEEVAESTFIEGAPGEEPRREDVINDKIEVTEIKIQSSRDSTEFKIVDARGDQYIVIDEVLSSSVIEETQDENTDHGEVDTVNIKGDESVEKFEGTRKRQRDQSEEVDPGTKVIKLEVIEKGGNADKTCVSEEFARTVETITIDSADEGTPDIIIIPDTSETEQLTKETQKRKCDNIEDRAPSAKIAKVAPIQIQKPTKTAAREITKSRPNSALTRIILANPMTSTWHFTFHNPYRVSNLIKQTPEYQRVEKIFKRTATRRMAISAIYRVENPYLLGMYLLKKEQMERACDRSHQVIERRLFHGTREENIDGICRYNFDWRRRGQSRGHKFGQGVSFSPKASYARHYNFGDDVMFLARVLVARMMEGNRDTVMPPEPYDTTRNNTGDVIVKYNDDDFYPEYIIYYYYNLGCGFFFNCW